MDVSLDAMRTDGWFERTGESVGSFQALCEILGERFFAFTLITGARVTALSVDRQRPDESLVEFQVGGAESEASDTQHLTLGRFRRRLVSALVAAEPPQPLPSSETDVEAIQRLIGVRFLLLAPLYGYRLLRLRLSDAGGSLLVAHDGEEREIELGEFRASLRALVIEELDHVAKPPQQESGLNLARVEEAARAFRQGDFGQVIELLGSWAAPLTLLLRTSDGQALDVDTKATLSHALVLLGRSVAEVGHVNQARDVLRLGVQYAVDTPKAGSAYARLGEILVKDDRHGEAIGALRRGANLGAAPDEIWPLLSEAFLERGRLLAALSSVEQGTALGLKDPRLTAVRRRVEEQIEGIASWRALVGSAGLPPSDGDSTATQPGRP